jgi:hypothetical protein
MAEQLALASHKHGVLVLDDTGDRKDGHATAHMAPQYIGSRGKIDNGIVAVTALWADERCYWKLHAQPYTRIDMHTDTIVCIFTDPCCPNFGATPAGWSALSDKRRGLLHLAARSPAACRFLPRAVRVAVNAIVAFLRVAPPHARGSVAAWRDSTVSFRALWRGATPDRAGNFFELASCGPVRRALGWERRHQPAVASPSGMKAENIRAGNDTNFASMLLKSLLLRY